MNEGAQAPSRRPPGTFQAPQWDAKWAQAPSRHLPGTFHHGRWAQAPSSDIATQSIRKWLGRDEPMNPWIYVSIDHNENTSILEHSFGVITAQVSLKFAWRWGFGGFGLRNVSFSRGKP